MSLATLLTQSNAILAILLFSRISGMMAFFPFFSHSSVSTTIKAAIAFYLVILFFPQAHVGVEIGDFTTLLLAVVMEFALGFIAGLALNLVFGAVGLAGMQISMVMGFSMATAYDPTTLNNSPITNLSIPAYRQAGLPTGRWAPVGGANNHQLIN